MLDLTLFFFFLKKLTGQLATHTHSPHNSQSSFSSRVHAYTDEWMSLLHQDEDESP